MTIISEDIRIRKLMLIKTSSPCFCKRHLMCQPLLSVVTDRNPGGQELLLHGECAFRSLSLFSFLGGTLQQNVQHSATVRPLRNTRTQVEKETCRRLPCLPVILLRSCAAALKIGTTGSYTDQFATQSEQPDSYRACRRETCRRASRKKKKKKVLQVHAFAMFRAKGAIY